MLTWLDRFTKITIETVQKGTPADLHKLMKVKTDPELMALLVRETAKKQPPQNDPKKAPLHLAHFIEPFFVTGARTLAIQLDPELSRTFAGARVKAKDDVLDLVKQHHAVYIDLPDSPFQIAQDEHEPLVLHAIFLKQRSDGLWALLQLSRGGRLRYEDFSELIFHWDWNAMYYSNDSRPADEAFVRNLKDLVKLSLLFYQTETESAKVDPSHEKLIAPVPFIDKDRLARLRTLKDRHAKQKTHSLFRILALRAPADRFKRPRSETEGRTWKLDHKLTVRGYFRMQPHGVGNKLRRLQYIEGYTKGEGFEKKTLVKLGR